MAKAHLLWSLWGLGRTFAGALWLGTLGALAGLAWLVRRKGASVWVGRGVAPFALFGLAQLASYVLFYHGGISLQPWRFVMQPVMAALAVGAGVEIVLRWGAAREGRFPRRLTLALVVTLTGGVLVSMAGAMSHQLRRQRDLAVQEPLFAAALWVDEELGPGTVVGAWNAGLISYVSRRPVVNLDGVVNSWRFHERERWDLCRYWRATGVSYVVDVFDLEKPFKAVAGETSACLDRLELYWSYPACRGVTRCAAAFEVPPPR